MFSLCGDSHEKEMELTKYKQITTYLIFSVCLIGLGFWIFRIIQNITMPELEYSEGFIVYLSQLFGAGQFHYGISAQPPFEVSFYTPLFYFIHGLMEPTLLNGRILVILCTVISLVLVYLIVYHMTHKKLISLIAALLPLTQYIVIQWTLVLRVDMMAVMFELAGIYIALRFWRSKWLYASIPLFLLAFWTKQSFFIGPLAVIITILLERNWYRVIRYSICLVSILAASLITAQYLSGGEFINQVFFMQRTSPMFQNFLTWAQWLIYDYWQVLPLIAIGLFFVFKQPKHLLTIFVGLTIVVNMALLSRQGSAQNYEFEVIFAMSIIGAIGLIEVIQKHQLIYIGLAIIIPLVALFSRNLMEYPPSDYQGKVDEAKAIIADADYPILTERPNMVLEAGKTPYLCDPFMFMNFTNQGVWNEQTLINDLESNRIPYVITQLELPTEKIKRFNSKVQQAITENYHIVMEYPDNAFSFYVYKSNKEYAAK